MLVKPASKRAEIDFVAANKQKYGASTRPRGSEKDVSGRRRTGRSVGGTALKH